MKLFLEFHPAQEPLHRRRLEYAFRCFCAIYGHIPLLTSSEMNSADVWISYREQVKANGRPAIHVPNLYRSRGLTLPAPAPRKVSMHGEEMVLIHGCSAAGADWLAEVFEWLSCADEHSTSERDPVGRIPFERSFVYRHGLDVRVPYAALAMRGLQRLLMPGRERPEGPRQVAGQFIVNTHDVDFYPLQRSDCVFRAAKNSLISLAITGAPGLACRQAVCALRAAVGGHSPFLSLEDLADSETRRGINASYYFIAQHGNRRDGNYRFSDSRVQRSLHYLESVGMEIGVHGSYASLDADGRLASEYDMMRLHGFVPQGGRQHWLRFDMASLIRGVQNAGALYDASLGWPDRVGFRAGACFAFPPYDFASEQPAGFLEIPLVIMDASLLQADDNSQASRLAKQLLDVSRSLGWGGFSVLWHPASFGGVQLPCWVGDLFWQLAARSLESSDRWVSAREFLDSARERYVVAGLLPRTALSATTPTLHKEASA